MDVEELRARARAAPEHEAEVMPPRDADRELERFVIKFGEALMSTATAAVKALDGACEQITGVKPKPGDGARLIFEAAMGAMAKTVVAAVAPELSPEARLAKEAAVVAAATAMPLDEVITGMKRLAPAATDSGSR